MQRFAFGRFAAFLLCLFSVLVAERTAAQTVVDVLVAPGSTWGLEYHDGFLWAGDDGAGFIYKLDPDDGSVLETLPTPYDENHIAFGANHGVAWDGTGFWIAGDFGKDFLYKVDPTGAFTDTIPTPTDAVGGLAWNGTHLLVTSYFPNGEAGILTVDTSDGSIVGSTLPTQGSQPYGIAVDPSDGDFWNGMDDNDGDPEIIWKLSALDGSVIESFDAPAQSPKGIAVGDGHLWIVANTIGGSGRRIYKIDPAGGGTPDITALPPAQDFGIVALGSTGTLSQTLRNDGDGDLVIDAISTTPPFSYDPQSLPATLAPDEELVFDVFFDPASAGDYAEALVVESNDFDEGTLEIDLAGTGVPPDPTASVSPLLLNFSDTGVGLVRGLTFTVENVGFADLEIASITSDLGVFDLPFVPVFPHALSTFETLEVQVVFGPTAPVLSIGTLSVASNDPGSPVVDVTARGRGEAASFEPGEIVWSADGIENVVTVLPGPDVTGDGVGDAVMESYDAGADGDPFRSFYGNSQGSGVPIWAVAEGASGGWGDQCLAVFDDVDGDTVADIIRGTAWGGRRVEVRSSADGSLIWDFDTSTQDGGGWVYSVASLPDVSGDGVSEVIAGAGTDGGAGTGARRLYCFDGLTGSVRFNLVSLDGFLSVAAIDDVDGDGLPDVVGGSGGNNADDRVYCVSGASFGPPDVIWDFSTGGSVYTVARIADVNDDGINDVVAGSWSNNVFCIDGVTGAQIWSSPTGNDPIRVVAVPDVTGDGIEDVAVAQVGSFFRVINGATGGVHWLEVTGGNVWSVDAIDDVDQDGVPDILAGAQDDLVYCVSGASGDLIWSTNVGALVYSVRAIEDVTGNGVPDVLAGTQFLSGTGGRIYCLEGGQIAASADPPVAQLPAGELRFRGFLPNPAPGEGAFVFRSGAQVREELVVDIHDPSGRRVRRLEAAARPGWTELIWDGRDARGVELPSGIYYYRAATQTRGLERGKITLLR